MLCKLLAAQQNWCLQKTVAEKDVVESHFVIEVSVMLEKSVNRITNFNYQTDYESTSDGIERSMSALMNTWLSSALQYLSSASLGHQHLKWSSASQVVISISLGHQHLKICLSALQYPCGIPSSAMDFECQHYNFKLSALKNPLKTSQHLYLQ
ncbi:hypothetical protein E3N88_23732 [Mikania micrantha]|uniref:Uncharacterized protein n=1 Tax=Mikania micrantha TaxID=192012 RepID=A0A5N6NE37_9ASTR|nr:hypothetical protein E3N88_23732 [Mikania micrantha]